MNPIGKIWLEYPVLLDARLSPGESEVGEAANRLRIDLLI